MPVYLTEKTVLYLYKKSRETNIPFDALQEVFLRSFRSWKPEVDNNRSREQFAFDGVNSFIHGGYAAELHEDLIKEDWIVKDNKSGKAVHSSNKQADVILKSRELNRDEPDRYSYTATHGHKGVPAKTIATPLVDTSKLKHKQKSFSHEHPFLARVGSYLVRSAYGGVRSLEGSHSRPPQAKAISAYRKLRREEVELDELTLKKVNDYIDKAIQTKRVEGTPYPDKKERGIQYALKKREGKAKVNAKEETNINELSATTLSSYTKKATSKNFQDADTDKKVGKVMKRNKYIETALNKITHDPTFSDRAKVKVPASHKVTSESTTDREKIVNVPRKDNKTDRKKIYNVSRMSKEFDPKETGEKTTKQGEIRQKVLEQKDTVIKVINNRRKEKESDRDNSFIPLKQKIIKLGKGNEIIINPNLISVKD